MSGSGDSVNTNTPPGSSEKRRGDEGSAEGRHGKFQRPTPPPLTLPPKESPDNYRYLELPNALRVLLISNTPSDELPPDPYWTQKFPSIDSRKLNFEGRLDEHWNYQSTIAWFLFLM